jgi:hypothetical protein
MGKKGDLDSGESGRTRKPVLLRFKKSSESGLTEMLTIEAICCE